jgi:hypothetical protein
MRKWQSEAQASLESARLARSLLPHSGEDIPDATRWESVGQQVEQAAQSLNELGDRAPEPEGATIASQAAEALRGLYFSLEADRLIRGATAPPTTGQLLQADAAIRSRTTELDTALDRLDRMGQST